MNDAYQAVICRGFAAGQTRIEDVARPPLGAGQVRVRIEACGVNYPDVLIIQGRYQLKPDLPFTPGIEAAGVVLEAGTGATAHRIGDRVVVRMRTGGFAAEAVVPAADVFPLPDGFSFAEGATFLVAHLTAFHGVATCGQVRAGQRVLALGAGGGVGRAAVQIAKHLGAVVVAAASSPAKAQLARDAGADAVVDPAVADLPQAIRQAIGGTGVDAIYDPVGLDPATAMRCLSWGGRVLIVGFAGGTIPVYPANRVLLQGASIIGVRAGEFGRRFPERRAREMAEIWQLARVHRPAVTQRWPLDQFAQALQALEDRHAAGRVVLIPNASDRSV